MPEELVNNRLLTKEEIEAEFVRHGYRQYSYISPSHDTLIKAQDAKTLSILSTKISLAISKLHEAQKCLGELVVYQGTKWANEADQFIMDAIRILKEGK